MKIDFTLFPVRNNTHIDMLLHMSHCKKVKKRSNYTIYLYLTSYNGSNFNSVGHIYHYFFQVSVPCIDGRRKLRTRTPYIRRLSISRPGISNGNFITPRAVSMRNSHKGKIFMHSTNIDFCPSCARASVLSTTHSAASRIRRSASLSGCPIGVEARRSMKEDCLSLPEADGSSAAPMARRTSATDGWVGAPVGAC